MSTTQPRADTLPIHLQLKDLFLIQLSNWRWSWRTLVLLGTVAPVASIGALRTIAGTSDAVTIEHILVGNVILAVIFQNQNLVAGNFAFMRMNGMITYFATLPIRRVLLPIATVAAFLLLSLPAILITTIGGAVVLDVELSPHVLLVVVIPLCVMPMASLGAAIGTLARSPEETGSVTLALTVGMMGVGPVVLAADRLPSWLVTVGWANPATYASSALRQTLFGNITGRLAADCIALVAFAALGMTVVERRLEWREL